MTTTTQPIRLKLLAKEIIDFYRTKTASGHGVPLLMEGPPGCGKTAFADVIAENLSAILGVPVVMINERLGNREHLDIKGYAVPTKAEDGRLITVYTVPDLIYRCEQINKQYDGKVLIILFFDELRQAPLPTQKVAAELLGDYAIGEYKFPQNVWMIAASNRRNDQAGVSKPLSIVENRMTTVPVENPVEDWAPWATTQQLPGIGISAARAMPHLFCTEVPKGGGAFMTNRSYTFALGLLKTTAERYGFDTERALPLGPDFPVQTLGVDGYIGQGARQKIEGWLKIGHLLPTMREVIADPDNAKVPPDNRLDAHWTTAQNILSQNVHDFEALWRYSERALNPAVLPMIAAHYFLEVETSGASYAGFQRWLDFKDEKGRAVNLDLMQAAMG